MRSGEGFLLLFSITDPDSFLHADTFRTDILHTKDTEILPPLGMSSRCGVTVFLCVV